MAWQKCPVCNGTGMIDDKLEIDKLTCPCCKGAMIIDRITGLPPAKIVEVKTSNTYIGDIIPKKPEYICKK